MTDIALPFRPNARTIQGTAFLWYDAELQVDVWLRDNQRKARFFIRSAPPQSCTAFFEPEDGSRSPSTVYAAPVGAIVSGPENVGRFEPSEDGTLVWLPCPAGAGTYTIKLSAAWPPPLNSPKPPHPDVPVYFATWVFAVATPGNPDFIEPSPGQVMGMVSVIPSDDAPPQAAPDDHQSSADV